MIVVSFSEIRDKIESILSSINAIASSLESKIEGKINTIAQHVSTISSKMDDIDTKISSKLSDIDSKIDSLRAVPRIVPGNAWRRYYKTSYPTDCQFRSDVLFVTNDEIRSKYVQYSKEVLDGPFCRVRGNTASISFRFDSANAPIPLDDFNGKIVAGIEFMVPFLADVTISAFTEAPIGLRFVIMDSILQNLDIPYTEARKNQSVLHIIHCGRNAKNGSVTMGCSDTARYTGYVDAIYIFTWATGTAETTDVTGDISITIRVLR